jgi:hypothetical protein
VAQAAVFSLGSPGASALAWFIPSVVDPSLQSRCCLPVLDAVPGSRASSGPPRVQLGRTLSAWVVWMELQHEVVPLGLLRAEPDGGQSTFVTSLENVSSHTACPYVLIKPVGGGSVSIRFWERYMS